MDLISNNIKYVYYLLLMRFNFWKKKYVYIWDRGIFYSYVIELYINLI